MYPALSDWYKPKFSQWNFEDENFTDDQLAVKTSKITSFKNLYIYGIYFTLSMYSYTPHLLLISQYVSIEMQGRRKQFFSGQANQLQICPDKQFRMIILV